MVQVLAQARFNRTTRLPQDMIVNTFHFNASGASLDPADATNILDRITDFYIGVTGTTPALRNYMSNLFDTGANQVETRLYVLSDPQPRSPVATRLWSLVTAGGASFPGEVALVLSERANPISGIPPARTRGRLYFGPITQGSGTVTNVSGDMRPDQPIITSLLAAGLRLMTPPALGPDWCVYSPTDGAMRIIRQCVVDNAWDTQRRRGADPTVRSIVNKP